MAAALSAVQYCEPEQSFSLYFFHALLLYSFSCASLHMVCPCFYFFASCVCRHIQNAHFIRFGGFFCSVCWRLRVAAAPSVGMKGRRREGARTPSLFSCGCGAPRVTALSWAPCPIEGGMAGNFGAASWMDEGSLARVRCLVAVGFCHFPGAVAMSWGRWWW
ncbi:hypothetical protein TcCL_NonESM09783, partial [Trypanosoma cruzi]